MLDQILIGAFQLLGGFVVGPFLRRGVPLIVAGIIYVIHKAIIGVVFVGKGVIYLGKGMFYVGKGVVNYVFPSSAEQSASISPKQSASNSPKQPASNSPKQDASTNSPKQAASNSPEQAASNLPKQAASNSPKPVPNSPIQGPKPARKMPDDKVSSTSDSKEDLDDHKELKKLAAAPPQPPLKD